MKTSKKKIKDEDLDESSGQTLDPYAVDFFGIGERDEVNEFDEVKRKSESSNGKAERTKILHGLNWSKSLPKISVREADFSNQINNLPKKLTGFAGKSFQKTFSRFTKIDEEKIGCEIIFISEVVLADSLIGLEKTSQVFLKVSFENKYGDSIIAINTEFATALVDLVLGGVGKSSDSLRSLSPIEQTIIEFLVANVFGTINKNLDGSKFALKNVGSEIDKKFKAGERGAEIILELKFDDFSGNITILLPSDLLNAIGKSDRSILLKDSRPESFSKIGKVIKGFGLKIPLGETRISSAELPFLEKDDVILIEKPTRIWQNREKGNSVRAYIGDGTNFYLRGYLHAEAEADLADILSHEVVLQVEEIVSGKDLNDQPKREIMDTKKEMMVDENLEEKKAAQSQATALEESEDFEEQENLKVSDEELDEETLASLGNIMVNLRVNLGGRRLSLAELQKIRVGQIIELGCRPADPVEIVTDSDNKPIATGDLIEIEGRLGVRLTKVFI